MSLPEVTVIDYGVGNLLSVQRGLEYCGAKVVLTADPRRISSAEKVVLPGVGAFGNAMHALDQLKLVNVIQELSLRGTPLLGICLGMQLLLDESEEFGITAGLGLIPGRVTAMQTKTPLEDIRKIPHIGWGALQPSIATRGWSGSLLQDNRIGDDVYFVHSFMATPLNPEHCVADCEYGGHLISAVIGRDNITGCQFHPEKSGKAGLKILNRFVHQ